jgi:hypothetical protein
VLVADDTQDSPNACVTLAIPTGIFSHVRNVFTTFCVLADVRIPQDILPKPEGFTKQVRVLGKKMMDYLDNIPGLWSMCHSKRWVGVIERICITRLRSHVSTGCLYIK